MSKDKNSNKRTERSAALDLLTDQDLQLALGRKRSVLITRLADIHADTLGLGWDEAPEEIKEQTERSLEVLAEAIEDIDRRLNGASDILRSFSGRGLKVVPPTEETAGDPD